jgi:hypothetical protein
MDQQTDTDLDETDEDILTYTVSDEALEAAAGAGAWTPCTLTPYQTIMHCMCCSRCRDGETK